MGNIYRILKGLLFSFLWFSSIMSSITLFFYPVYFILFFNPYLHRKISVCLNTLGQLNVSFLAYIFNIKLVLSGDHINTNESVIYMMNHRTSTDWNFIFTIAHTSIPHLTKDLKIVVKDELRHIPFIGWIMQGCGYLFLTRSWKEDERRLRSSLSHMVTNLGGKMHLLIFPEGTDFNHKKKVRSDIYAEANGLPKYDYVLHPKTTGFCFMTEFLRNSKALDAVYDITIGYPDIIPQSELDMLKGKLPKEVHMHIQKIVESELPDDNEGLKNWLNERWLNKEKLLEEFYKNKRFSDECWPECRIWTRYLVAAYYLGIISLTYTLLIFSPVFRLIIFMQWIFFVGLSLSKYNLTDLEIVYFRFWEKNVKNRLLNLF